jgi:hypothetical protein
MKITGHVDLCGPELIEGWLHCDVSDGQPIKLQVYVDALLVGECIADRFRADLQTAGFGDGHCGFSFHIPADLNVIDFASTKLRLVDSPVYLLPSTDTKLPDRRERARIAEPHALESDVTPMAMTEPSVAKHEVGGGRRSWTRP